MNICLLFRNSKILTFQKHVDGRVYDEWAVFSHMPDKIFTDWTEVGLEIIRDTERLCGTNKSICDTQIGLRVFSPHVVSLTLIDLPGITRVPVGDQPEDIEDQIVNMVCKYIQRPNTLILAVTAANVDFATSEAIKLARRVDPSGKRTLAVLTKIDLMGMNKNISNSKLHLIR